MTIWPAYQHFEEKTKGSIEAGKVADLVILSDNPPTIERARIVNLKVLETVKEGKSISNLPRNRLCAGAKKHCKESGLVKAAPRESGETLSARRRRKSGARPPHAQLALADYWG